MKRGKGERKSTWHVVGGFPDDDCPVCKAHGIDPEAEGLRIFPMPLQELLNCPCPLCMQAKGEPLDN